MSNYNYNRWASGEFIPDEIFEISAFQYRDTNNIEYTGYDFWRVINQQESIGSANRYDKNPIEGGIMKTCRLICTIIKLMNLELNQ